MRVAVPTLVLSSMVLVAGGCTPESDVNRIREAPWASILSPVQEAQLRQGTGPVVAEGAVSDSWDKAQDLTVTWTLDGLPFEASPDADGHIWLDLDLDGLTLGAHELGLSALDSDGDLSADSRVFDLGGPYSAPEVLILSPGDGEVFELGANIALLGEASDISTPAEELTFAWTSDLDGQLIGSIDAKGRTALFTTTLSEGTHLITLTATDTDGDTGQAQVTVQVGLGEEVVEEVELTDEALPGDLVFSEMMIHPLVDDELGEWVELYNTSDYAIDVSGYSFHDDDVDHYTLDGPLIVQPNDYLVLCASLDPKKNGGVTDCDGWFLRDSNGSGLALANKPDEVVLSRPDGVEIDWLHYDESWINEGVALGVDPDFRTSGENDRLDHWCAQTSVMYAGAAPGTPGTDNDDCP